MFRRRKPQVRSEGSSRGSSFIAANPIGLNDEAQSSINLDRPDYNDDGAELVSHARRIIDRATNQEIGASDYDNYMIKLAQNVLTNEPGRRLKLVEEEEKKPAARGSSPMFSQGLNEGHQARDIDGFFEETHINGDFGGNGGGGGWNNAHNYPAVHDDEEEDESIFTMNIDAAEEKNAPGANQLARTFNPTDFKWLSLGGAIPLTMICGMSNGISYCGPAGMIIGFCLVTPGVLIVLACISEMIAFYPMDGGFTLLVCEYIEAPLGLAIGVMYWLNCALTVPIELLQSIKLMLVFPYLDNEDNNNIVFLTFYLAVLLVFAMLTTRAQSPAIRFASMISASSIVALFFIIWVVCIPREISDGVALRFWHESHGFRPPDSDFGNSVNRWRQVGHACSLALRSYNGIDVIFTAMPEIRNARRTIKSGFRWLSFRILVIYLVLIVSFTFITDPAMWDVLFSPERMDQTVCKVKPIWIRELMRDGIFCSFLTSLSRINKCTLFYVINAFIVFCGVFDAGIQLYGASRTLHGLGYSGVLWKQLSWCTREHVPVVAVLISMCVAAVAYTSVGARIDAVFTYLQLFVTHSYLLIWATVCWAFIRFFRALKIQEKRTHVSRDSDEYPFKSWLQPYSAILAILWCIGMFTISSLEQYYYNSSFHSAMWKGNFLASSLPIFLTGIMYLGMKFYRKSSLVSLNKIGIMAAKRKMDAEEWEEDRVYSDGLKERLVRWLA